jgi:hypothetical protein
MAKTTDKTPEQAESQKLVVKVGFSACEDGCVVNTYAPGEYDDLPAVALEHGLAISAFSDDSVELAKAALESAKLQQSSEE